MIPHSLIRHIMSVQGFSTGNIRLVQSLSASTASAVCLPTGMSAWIENLNRSGVLQVAPKSFPIANLVVVPWFVFSKLHPASASSTTADAGRLSLGTPMTCTF